MQAAVITQQGVGKPGKEDPIAKFTPARDSVYTASFFPASFPGKDL